MNIKSKENKEHSAVELVIEVGAAEFDAAQEAIYRKNRKNIMIPGFRKGKATRKMIENMYGAGVFFEDAVDELYPAAYEEAVKQEGLEPVAPPQINVTEVGKEGFTFTALITLKPEYKVGEYKGLAATKSDVKVTEKDIDEEMKPLVQRATRLVAVTRKAKKGDTAVIDFEGFVDGVAFEGGKGENHPLELGSNSFIPGFEDALIGTKTGEGKDVEVTFPEEYTPELAGKAAVFKVKVNEVKESQAPTLDDEFAKDVSEFETLEDLRKDLGEKLTTKKTEAAEQEFEDSLMESMMAVLEVELPEAMIDSRANQVLQEYAQRFEGQGLPFQQYLQMTGQTMESMKLQAAEAATHQIKYEMALEGVAAGEKMEISTEEFDVEYQAMADQYSMDVAQVKAVAVEDEVRTILLRRKALAFLKDNAKVSKPKKATKKAAPKKKAADEATEAVAEETAE